MIHDLPGLGMKILCSDLLTETVQHSRSPSRAARRMLRGFPQHYIRRPQQKALVVQGVIYMHPAMYDEFRRAYMAGYCG